MILCGWRAWAALPGDVNGDGAVNVADLFRAQKMAVGDVSFEESADIDGDGAVTDIDLFLIQEATLGRPIPERVGRAVIGTSGGTLSHGDVTITFAPGATASETVALFRCPDEELSDGSELQNVYMVCGITTNQTSVGVAFDNCGSDCGLCVGSYFFPYEADTMSWNWAVLPGPRFNRAGAVIRQTFDALEESPIAVLHTVKFAVTRAEAPPPVVEASFSSLKVAATTSTVPGYKYSGYKYTGWIGDLFHVYTPNWGTVSYDDLQAICGILNETMIKMNGTLGFPVSDLSSRFPLDVYVIRDLKNYGEFVNIPMLPWKIEIRHGLPASELKATLGHEVMHFVLDAYMQGDSFAFGSIEDALTTWFEAIATENPDHLSGNYTRQPAHVLKGLFVPITRVWIGLRNFGPQQERGYANSAFIDYHFSSHPEWAYELSSKIDAGQNIKEALDSLFTEKYGALYDLEWQYRKFVRDYMMYSPACYSADLLPRLIFSGGVPKDMKGMYKSFMIKKASTNMLEEQTVDLTVQDYGCGVVQWTLQKPDRIVAPHTRLRVAGPKLCKGLDLILRYQDENQNWHSEIVTGTYDSNEDEGKQWSCEISLPPDTLNILLYALVTMGNQGQVSVYTEQHDLSLTVQFVGDYYMPMQESFSSYTELSSGETFYASKIVSDAIFRMVDPASGAGLDSFLVQRDVINDAQPDLNYSIHAGSSSPFAKRKTPSAFQIQLFADMTVPELEPHTINISTNGYSAWTPDVQKPLLAADGSPQIELMVYNYPDSVIDQIIPGEAPYRVQHQVTSVNQLRQGADGTSGGIIVDVPDQVGENGCVIYLFAREEDGSLGELAFVARISGGQEEGQ